MTKRNCVILLLLIGQAGCGPALFNDTEQKDLSSKNSASDLAAAADDSEDEAEIEAEDEVLTPAQEAAAAQACLDFAAGAATLKFSATSSMNHVRGKIIVAAAKLSLDDARGPVFAASQQAILNNLRGTLCLLGMNPLGKASLTDHRGRTEITGMNMDIIENNRGAVIMRGGELKVLRNHRGSVRLIGVKVGAVDNVRGAITLEGGSAVVGPITNSDPVQIK